MLAWPKGRAWKMSYLTGQSHDPILKDIKDAVREGYFDDPDRETNKLATTPVEQLLKATAMMSRPARRAYLATLGNLRTGGASLTGTKAKGIKKARLT